MADGGLMTSELHSMDSITHVQYYPIRSPILLLQLAFYSW